MHNFLVHSNDSACRKSVRLGLDQVFVFRLLKKKMQKLIMMETQDKHGWNFQEIFSQP